MDQRKIDQLFREKLGNLEVTPSHKAWQRVEKKIGRNTFPVKVYWMAASVAVAMLSWVLWPVSGDRDMMLATGDMYPRSFDAFEWTIPSMKAEASTQVVTAPAGTKLRIKKVDAPPTNDLKLNEPIVKDALAPELKSRTAMAMAEIDPPAIIGEPTMAKEVDNVIIKVTYVADNEVAAKNELKKERTITKIFAFAEKVSPGNMLSELKTAKDDWINGDRKQKATRY